MADNKENSRADLFEILNELHDDSEGGAQKPQESAPAIDTASHVDEILQILSSGAEQAEENSDEPTEEEGSLPE